MDGLRNVLNKFLNFLGAVTFAAMVLLTCWQVLTRYVLGNPSSWSEELVSYLFAWATLIGACVVSGERGHMNIPIVVEKMGENAQKIFKIFAEVIAFLFSGIILTYGGVQITSLAMGQLTSSLGVAIGVFYIILPVCGIVNMLYSILNVIDICKGKEA
ncbi:MAG: TRAP transporter small permease [Clostridia bacterium]|nr:TRAP transporter small permease [Clostridia bacterium]